MIMPKPTLAALRKALHLEKRKTADIEQKIAAIEKPEPRDDVLRDFSEFAQGDSVGDDVGDWLGQYLY